MGILSSLSMNIKIYKEFEYCRVTSFEPLVVARHGGGWECLLFDTERYVPVSTHLNLSNSFLNSVLVVVSRFLRALSLMLRVFKSRGCLLYHRFPALPFTPNFLRAWRAASGNSSSKPESVRYNVQFVHRIFGARPRILILSKVTSEHDTVR
jgi:hypothetical protein